MKQMLTLIISLFSFLSVFSQSRVDSLTNAINETTDLNEKAKLLISRSKAYPSTAIDKPLADAQQALAYFQQTKNQEGQVDAYLQVSGIYSRQNKYRLALDFDSTAFSIASKIGYKRGTALAIRGLGRNHLSLGNLETAKGFTLQALKQLMDENLEREAGDLHNQLGIIYRRLSDMKKSLYHFDEGIAIANKHNIEPLLAYLLMNKANTLNEGSRYDEAIKLHLESIRLKEKLKDERGLIQSYNNISLVYKLTKQFSEALTNFEKANFLARKVNNKTSLANNYSNIADIYRELNKKDSVAKFYEAALALFNETEEQAGLGMVYHNFGQFMLEENKLDEAETMLKKALEIREKTKSKFDVASTLNALGVLYSKKGLNKEAEENMLKALAMVKNENDLLQKDVYRSLASHYKQVGKVDEAYKYQASYISISDTLVNEKEITNILKLQNQYEMEKKDAEILVVNKEKEIAGLKLQQKNRQLYYTAGGIILLCLLLLLLSQAYRRKRMYSKTIEQKNQKIETLIRELHHRVKNNLQVVSGLLSLQSNRLQDDSARQAMEEGKTRVNAMAMIHQKLYMDKELASVDIEEYLQNLTESLASSFGFEKQRVQTSVSLAQKSMNIDTAIPVGLIVNELVTNAFKHAFRSQQNPHVHISMLQKDAGLIELQVADNGSEDGITNAGDNSASFGMKLVHTLVDQLNGTINMYHDGGRVYNIQIRA